MSFSIIFNSQYEIIREKLHATLNSLRKYYTIPICFRFESAFRKEIRFEWRYIIGPQAGYSTVGNIFNLTSIINLKFHEKKKVFCRFFILYLAILYFLNFHYCALLYKNTNSQVWDGNCSVSDPLCVLQGVKQGCLWSPLLFSLYINDLHECLPGGVIVADTLVKVLLYVDDLIILSESELELQTMINSLYK